jgi:hypothetical protein
MINENPTTGAIKSPPDYRDIRIAQVSAPREYPPSFFVDVSKLPVWHQRKIGACVGHAMAKYKQKLDLDDTGKVEPLSARFLYAMAKAQDNYAGEGTYPRLVAKILKDVGCATEATCPNDTTLDHESYVYNRKEENIPTPAKDEAYKAKIAGYAWADLTKEGLKQCIVDFNGGAMLVRLDKNWWTDIKGIYTYVAAKLFPLRAPKENISGHEVYLMGYRDIGNGDVEFHHLGSWGDKWGDNGTGYFLWSEYKEYIDEVITYTDIPNHLLEEANNKPAEFKYKFTRPIEVGETSEEVKQLQSALKMYGTFDFAITGYYGSITAKAVLDFQKKETILSWYERYVMRGQKVGPKTLEALNRIYNK